VLYEEGKEIALAKDEVRDVPDATSA